MQDNNQDSSLVESDLERSFEGKDRPDFSQRSGHHLVDKDKDGGSPSLDHTLAPRENDPSGLAMSSFKKRRSTVKSEQKVTSRSEQKISMSRNETKARTQMMQDTHDKGTRTMKSTPMSNIVQLHEEHNL